MANLTTSIHRYPWSLRPVTASLAIAAVLLTSSAWAQAKDNVLMEGAGIQIKISDVQAEMLRMPDQVRAQLADQPDMLRQLVNNLYLRRALATAAVQQGLDKRPNVVALLKSQQESVLAEARVTQISDASLQPEDPATEQLARDIYKAETQRFEQPAQTRARHILVKGSDAEARAKAEKLLADLKAGANFEALAEKESADPGSAAKGGDLGFFGKGRMVKPFEDAVEALKQPGELSGIVQSAFGFHIIRLEERKPANLKPFEEVREQLRLEASAKAQQDARKKEIERLQKEAKGDETTLEELIASLKKSAEASKKPAQ